jgi:DNA polymerase III sliding clamp (beta) subunit (PCNA family)
VTRVVFETAGLADVLRKVKSIAPSRGQAFDKAAGIVITVYPEHEATYAIIRATNLDLYYKEWLPVLECDAVRETSWRVAAKISDVISTLPIGSGKTVAFDDSLKPDGRTLTVKSGRMKNNWQLLPIEYYPEWETFDPDGLTAVENFGSRLSMVEWAADDNESTIPLSGVNLDGVNATATDTYRLARVPLAIDAGWVTAGPVTVPSKLLAQLVKQTGTVQVGATDSQLLVMPDPSVQIRTALYAVPYPTAGVERIAATEHDGSFEAPKGAFLDLFTRAMVMLQGDRFPMIDLFIGKSEVAVHAIDLEEGALGDVLDVPGFAAHKRINYLFTPKYLMDAIEKCPADRVYVYYDTENPLKIMKISDGGGYNVWIVPRRNRPARDEATGAGES